ncbi:NapC/NirT family cytochrome c [Magnetospira sp. QH-2]|uniref:NapC/NirT family cytochrome c n=1 Tax=Magnetospira sp. (strain QH-2) TaxID=1288970 RepID=UPI0003E80F9E|nr:NapC/NirT family cytochrome c [Magnetospira sp. QH-2]CCQ73251.1 Tetraheme cytochrome-c type, NapC/NirT cytochrome c [Magnetospira sp. QH-2]
MAKPTFRSSRAWIFLFLLGGLFGALALGGFNYAMDRTNETAFCISCHEMQNAYAEYSRSIHFKNPSGVQATCADCHVPKAWGPKLWRKIEAVRDIYHHLLGTIDTPEKYEAHRLEMAERVWARMEANHSAPCLSCHSYHDMDFDKQRQRSRDKMKPAMEKGEPCIECHKGIAHKKPMTDDD